MALADRVITIDDASASPLDVSALIVGGAGDFGGTENALMDLTGPAATRARKKLTGFVINKPFTLTFEYTSAIKTAFYNGATANNPRTCKVLWASGDYYQVEANITSVQPKTEPGENAITTLEVTFDPTGTETIA